jgi:signal transduction histidine kinase
MNLISKNQQAKHFTLLVVDDNPNNLAIAVEQLEDKRFKVATAKNGESGLKRAKSIQPDLILLDVIMPGMDGFETCRRLKLDALTCHIPVIFMTALNQEADKVKGFEVGAVDYITKPIQAAEMLARVKTHLQLYCLKKTLEQEVEARTAELSQALASLKATQQELIQSEKMRLLGQIAASIAHEINTPLGVIRTETSNIRAAFSASMQQFLPLLPHLSAQQQADFLNLIQEALTHQSPLSTKEERQLRRQLQSDLIAQGIAQADKIASQLILLGLGSKLNAYPSILHAPNCSDILQVAYNLVLQEQSTRRIQQEVDRAAKIVFALKTYSHQSYRGDKSFTKIADGIEVALTLYQNRLKHGIEIVRHYEAHTPKIFCNPDELTQVWINLIDNAIYAMKQQGRLEIEIAQQAGWLLVAITDSGEGIAPELRSRIFEPFFTTKPRGEGSGLGLDIVRQIVQRHDGKIQVDSQPGRTTFRVFLPLPRQASIQPSAISYQEIAF